MKAIKSTDPRKSTIVRFLKAISGADKITSVREDDKGIFWGRAFKSLGGRKYEYLGETTIDAKFKERKQAVLNLVDAIERGEEYEEN